MDKRVLLLNDTEDVYHWGCYGTSKAIKDQLVKKGITEIDCMTVAQTHSLANIPTKLSEFGDKETFSCSFPEIADKLDKCDAVVINGEGTIHGFKDAPRALLYLAYASKQYFGKKVMLINHSCYPKSCKPNVLNFYKAAYSSCDYVAARESRSTRIVENRLGVKCVRSFDSLPLTIKSVYDQIPQPLLEKPYICISGAVNYNTAKSPIIARRLLNIYPQHNYVYLVGSKNGANSEEPRVYESLKKFIPSIELFDAKSFLEWLSVIRHSELLLSGRFHYTIAALCLGTRAICFRSNTPKINSVVEDLNLPAVIPKQPSFLFESMLWYQMKKSNECQRPDIMSYLCSLAQKNYDWDI